jgi:hypothetical protein
MTIPEPRRRLNYLWQDPAAAWWAKAERARSHIGDINSMVAAFNPRSAYEVLREPTDEAGKTALRLHGLRSLPTELLTTVGDALHNLRSCLDSVAFELARRHLGDRMTEAQQGATQFPLCADRAAFDDFLSRRSQSGLYGEPELNALRCAQPFALREEAAEHGVSFATTPQDEYRINQLVRLHQLNIRDKHRYLPLLAWYLDFAYFTGEEPGLRELRFRAHSLLRDGDIIGHVAFDPAGSDPAANLNVEMRLAFADDPGYASDFLDALSDWHRYLTQWILPRVFTVAEGNPPPIAFFAS